MWKPILSDSKHFAWQVSFCKNMPHILLSGVQYDLLQWKLGVSTISPVRTLQVMQSVGNY